MAGSGEIIRSHRQAYPDDEALFKCYAALAAAEPNLHFVGRLAKNALQHGPSWRVGSRSRREEARRPA